MSPPGAVWRAIAQAAGDVEETFFAPTVEPFDRRVQLLRDGSSWRGRSCPRCGSPAHESEAVTLEAGCGRCRQRKMAWSRCVRLGTYEGELRTMIHQLKFERWAYVGDRLGRLLGVQLRAAMLEAGVGVDEARVVPVATSFRRRMERNIDHTMVLSRAVSCASGVALLHMLTRRHRPSQRQVPAGQRAANVRLSFVSRPLRDPGVRLVVLVDDVITTGATMTAACRAIRGSGKLAVEAWACVVAVPASGDTSVH